MYQITRYEPIDYLVIGHIARDLTPEGSRLGGTAAFAALTAQALGLRVGVVTSWGDETVPELDTKISIVNFRSEHSTTFENVSTSEGRIQFVHHLASNLSLNLIPDTWRNPSIVHLGPIAHEVDPTLVRNFPSALIGVTPQGWLRTISSQGRVYPGEWPESSFVLQKAGAAVMSLEDVGGDENRIEDMASACRILAVTEAEEGARIYWNGDVRRFHAPNINMVDDTGAGDIFAAAFFVRLLITRDPWEAARFATHLSAYSVARIGLQSVPTAEEIEATTVEVF
ncbi:MAG TPA: PfkB family carbohydrate kinase [Anaerolineales bacterium]|nr:PfkB family carbohydrate kinase [Anaerolineales bacterium]